MSVQGKLSTMGMGDLVQWAHVARKTGILVVKSSEGAERRIVFEDGRVAASSTNSPREYFGRFVVEAGYCSAADVEKALEIQRQTGYTVAAVLVMTEKLTEPTAIALLEEKTIDHLCDIFLWPEGEFQFEPQKMTAKRIVRVNLDPTSVVLEGFRRLDEWNRMTAMIHPASTFESTRRELVEDETWEDVEMAKRVLPHLDGENNLGDVIERIPYSVYRIYRALSELLARGLVRQGDITGVAMRDRRLQQQLERARAAQEQGHFAEALKILEGLTVSHPSRPEIAAELARAAENLKTSIYANSFVPRDVPVMAMTADKLGHLKLVPKDAFLLSRIDGRTSVADIFRISAMKEVDAVQILKRLYDAHVIDFVSKLRKE